LVTAVLVLATALALGAAGCGGGGSSSSTEGDDDRQVVRFQRPTEPGPDPFTRPADRSGPTTVTVTVERTGQGPYGGTGSDLVCDRELLIRSLRARPDRLRAWALVRHLSPTYRAVATYIRSLRPVTLTRDTRITNHSFVGGQAIAFQSILQAGTAVLVDEKGIPVARCRCGNPLLEPIYIPEAICLSCPPQYEPPPPCQPYGNCWRRYPDPPPIIDVFEPETTPTTTAEPPAVTEPPPAVTEPPPATTEPPPPPPPPPATTEPPPPPASTEAPPPPPPPTENPSAAFSPSSGPRGVPLTFQVLGFAPNAALNLTLTWPDGTVEQFTLNADASGQAQRSFQGFSNNPLRHIHRRGREPVHRRPGSGAVPARRLDADAPITLRGRSGCGTQPLKNGTKRASRGAPKTRSRPFQWTRPALPRRPKEFHTQLLRAQPSVKVSRGASPAADRSLARRS